MTSRASAIVFAILLLARRAAAEPVDPIERALDERNEEHARAMRASEQAERARREHEAAQQEAEARARAAFDARERRAAEVEEANAARVVTRRSAYVVMGIAVAAGAAGYLLPWREAREKEDAIAQGTLATSADIESAARDVRTFEGLSYATWGTAGVTLVIAGIVALAARPRSVEAALTRTTVRF